MVSHQGLCAVVVLVLSMGCVNEKLTEARRDKARVDMQTLQTSLSLAYLRTARYPSTAEGLDMLVQSKLLERVPRDPWGHAYVYRLDDKPTLLCLGADGAVGGEGDNKDFGPEP